MKKATWLRVASPALGLVLSAGMLSGFSAAKPVATSSTVVFSSLANWSYLLGTNPLYSGSIGQQLEGTVNLPLAWMSMINGKDNAPGIASHWAQHGKTFDIWIRPDAKWSNGTPVTTKDVITSIDIAAYYESSGIGPNLGSAKPIGPDEVQVTEVGNNSIFIDQLLNMTFVVSAAEFSKYVPSDLATLFKESTGSNAKVAAKAGTQLSDLYHKAAAAKVPLLSNGPYVVTGLSSSEAVLGPNKDFWAAKTIEKNFPVQDVYYANSNATSWPYYLSNRMSFANNYGPMTIIREWLHTNGHLIVRNPGFGVAGMALNPDTAPFNNQSVRQAIAYLIHRGAVTNIGDPVVGEPSHYVQPAFPHPVAHSNMTASQLASLNTYSYNSAKASALLRSAGFKYHNKTWYMPDGKPFAFTIWLPPGLTDWEADAEVIAGELTKAGIHATASIAPGTTFNINVAAGKDQAYMQWGGTSNQPYDDAAGFIGYYGYDLNPTTGTFSHSSAMKINLGPLDGNYKLTNGQTVNVVKDTLALQTATGAQQSKLMTQISEAYNQAMIYLPIFSYAGEDYVDAQDITGWPKAMAPYDYYNQNGQYTPWMYMGWLKPRNPVPGTCAMSNAPLKVLDSVNIDGCPDGGVSGGHA